jgi:hypothetical protein
MQSFSSRYANLARISHPRHNKNGDAGVHCMALDHTVAVRPVPTLFFVDHEVEQSSEYVADQELTAEESELGG